MSRTLFLVLAYRQESYIGQAVRAALSQDGPALDIVVSDDCSTDATWEIIQQTIQGYSGPHTIASVRNDENLGLIPHLNKRIAETEARHIIVAAGDDISEPNRALRVKAAFEATDALLVHSDFTAIDETGAPTDAPPVGKFKETTNLASAARSLGLYVGATGAWNRELFTKYGPLPDGLYEDLVLGFRAALEQRIAYVDEPLVKYRVNIGLSARPPQDVSLKELRGMRRVALLRGARTFEQRMSDAKRKGLSESDPVMRLLRGKCAEFRARLEVLGKPGSQLVLDKSLRTPRHFRAWRSERKREAGHR